MSIIPRCKFGDCVECGAKKTNCVKHGKSLYCLGCRDKAKKKKQIEKAESRDDKRSGVESNDSLREDLDFVFSRYVRIREADTNGIAQCYTCDSKMHWTKLQAGHFIKRSDTGLRWDSRNAKPQCVECNCNKHGNIDEYTKRLDAQFPGISEELKQEGREVNKFTREDLKSILLDLRHKLKIAELRFK